VYRNLHFKYPGPVNYVLLGYDAAPSFKIYLSHKILLELFIVQDEGIGFFREVVV
jgi:hypothetical protein